MKLKQILNKFELTQKIITYVKDEGSNLQTCVRIINSIMSCTDLNMVKPFDGFYSRHALLKCEYATSSEKVFCGLHNALINICPN
jgi:hypothetical protein